MCTPRARFCRWCDTASLPKSLHFIAVAVNVKIAAISFYLGLAILKAIDTIVVKHIIISCGDDHVAALVNKAVFAIDFHHGQAFAEKTTGPIISCEDDNVAALVNKAPFAIDFHQSQTITSLPLWSM